MRTAALLFLALLAPGAGLAQSFDVSVTVDDLPVHGALPPGMTRLSIARSHIETFKAHGVKEAFGFVNSANATDVESNAVLDAWRAAGHPLGNHTASHLNLEKAETLQAWIADLEAGEPAVAQRMKGQDWRYLRFPNLTAGTRPERHQGAAAYLAAHGYKVAHVTISFSDWSYSDAYARCLAKGDQAAIKTMEDQYLRGADDELANMRTVSQAVYGRMIPQVLLTHIGGWSAHMLPKVMDRLDAAGARYVTLEKAQRDPAYAQAEAIPGGGGIMERTAKARGIALPATASTAARVDPKTLCR
ncbi:polysaccharide deacetylase family protein [Caulobacter endophyticus]|uniref:polysaccharide deacetylase family protein n=1 Tax=Caulobacter endophyticus TaxID=2172652 RepID=UPI002410367D|nr:polysaccharide deacetylase family protein [Caulobacter endophyticus]MDG2528933.1 polysaccharide deacetylase family protein [Caulobacter endophyticus]